MTEKSLSNELNWSLIQNIEIRRKIPEVIWNSHTDLDGEGQQYKKLRIDHVFEIVE